MFLINNDKVKYTMDQALEFGEMLKEMNGGGLITIRPLACGAGYEVSVA
jgi:hypothetical protein